MTKTVKIRYHWRIRLKMLASIFVHYSRGWLRPLLREYDRFVDGAFFSFKAEGYTDLSFTEWLNVKVCEWKGTHIGQRTTIGTRGFGPSSKFCSACRCDWRKFDKT